jgi:hypothetical protein
VLSPKLCNSIKRIHVEFYNIGHISCHCKKNHSLRTDHAALIWIFRYGNRYRNLYICKCRYVNNLPYGAYSLGERGGIVVEALCYKPGGRGSEFRWGESLFSIYCIFASCYIRLTLNICFLSVNVTHSRLQFMYLCMLLVWLLLNTLYFSILLHSFDTEYSLFSSYLILPAALGPGVYSESNRNEYPKQENNVSGSRPRPVGKADKLTAIC